MLLVIAKDVRCINFAYANAIFPYIQNYRHNIARRRHGATAERFGTAALRHITSSTSPRRQKYTDSGGVNISLVDDDINVIDQNPALLGSEMRVTPRASTICAISAVPTLPVPATDAQQENAEHAASIRKYFGYGSMKETLPTTVPL